MAALQMSSRPDSSGGLLDARAPAPPPSRAGLAAAGTTASTTRRQKGHLGVLSGVASHTCSRSGTAAFSAKSTSRQRTNLFLCQSSRAHVTA
jgi:hypothetical protein